MSQPTELPVIGLLMMVAAGLIGMLLLLILCTPVEVHKRHWEELKEGMRELIEPHALFFKWNAGITVGMYVLGRVCLILGILFEWPQFTSFANGCISFAMLSCLGFLWILKLKAEEQQRQRVGEALLGPRTIMKTDIGALHNYWGNVASGGKGSQINQTAFGNSIALHQQIHSLIDSVTKSGNELGVPQKGNAIENLNILADQSMRPAAQRDESKIMAPLKVLPGLLSSASALAQEWDKARTVATCALRHRLRL